MIQELVSLRQRIEELEQSESVRKKAEEALRESEERYRLLIENTPEVIYSLSAEDGTITSLNPAFESITGWSRAEWLGKPFMPLMHPDDLGLAAETFQQVLRGEIIQPYELRILSRSGKYISGEFTSVPNIEKGKVIGEFGIARDITDRKRAEDMLHRSEGNFRRSLDESPLGVRIITAEGETIYANRAILDIYGYDSLEELKITPVKKRYTPESLAEHQMRREKRKRGDDAPIEYEINIVRKDGEVRHLQVFRKEILWDTERQFQVLYSDITDRKRAEEELHITFEKYRVLFDAFPLGISITDAVGHIIETNRESERLLKISREEQISRNYVGPEWQIICPDGTPMPVHEYASVRAMKENCLVENVEMGIVKGNQEITWINVTAAPIPLKNFGVAIAYGDITARKQAEEALRENEIRYRELFNNISSGAAIYEVTNNGNDFIFKDFNLAGERLDGDRKEDIIGKSIYQVRPGINKFGLLEVFKRVWTTGISEHYPAKFYQDEQLQGWYENFVYRLPSGEIVAVYDDITERKQAEEELRVSRAQLRALAGRLQQIREEERLMVAREIHDEMGGGLTGLKMDLSWLLRKIGNADPGEERVALMDKIHTSNALIDQMIKVVRRISADLRPSVLDDLGMIAALSWQSQEFTSRTEIQCEFVTSIDYINLEDETAIGVFRVFQEALTNVIRHSQATKVVVVLREDERSLFGDESLVLEIRDNGRGITEEEILNPESLGLLGMKERVLAFGGEFSIRGEPGGGTSLVLKIPRHKIPSPQV